MKKTFAFLAITAFLVIGALPSAAQGNTYMRKPTWKGDLTVIDASTGAPIDGAYVVSRNVPLGTYTLGLQVINNDDGRIYDKTDASGKAKAQIRPLGTLLVWKPGYWAIQELNFLGDSVSAISAPDADGVVVVRLKAASATDRKAAALQAAEWMEYQRRDSIIGFGKRKKRSAELRAESRQALIDEGVPAE